MPHFAALQMQLFTGCKHEATHDTYMQKKFCSSDWFQF